MATGATNSSAGQSSSGPIGGSSAGSQPLSSDEVRQAVRFLNESAPRMQRNETTVQQWTGVVAVAFVVLLITVAALVISAVYNQVQTYSDSALKSQEALRNVDEELIHLKAEVEILQNDVKESSSAQSQKK